MAPNEQLCPTPALHSLTVGRASRLDWEKVLSDLGAGGYSMIVGFRCYLDPTRGLWVANHFLLRVNRHLFGKRFRRNGDSLTGAIVLEHKRHSSRSSNSPHFHIIVSERNRSTANVDEMKLSAASECAASRLRYPTLERLRPLGGLISGAEFVHVRRNDDPDYSANYVTKDCGKFGHPGDAINIGFFGIDGIVGLEAVG